MLHIQGLMQKNGTIAVLYAYHDSVFLLRTTPPGSPQRQGLASYVIIATIIT